MINSSVKDQILKDLVNTGIHLSLNMRGTAADYGLNRDELRVILDQFEKLELCSLDNTVGVNLDISLTARAFEFSERGGFTAKDAHDKASLEKLQLEIQSLQKSFPEKTAFFTGILSNLATVSALFLP